MIANGFHYGKLSLYSLLSVADLFLTYQLLQNGGGRIYESNPIANAWLVAYGWLGLVTFKLLAVCVVGSVAALLSFRHPRLGGNVLGFACIVLAGVVVYSCTLIKKADANNTNGEFAKVVRGRYPVLRVDAAEFDAGLRRANRDVMLGNTMRRVWVPPGKRPMRPPPGTSAQEHTSDAILASIER